MTGTSQLSEAQSIPKEASSLAQPAADSKIPTKRTHTSPESTVPEVQWDSLIEFKDTGSSNEAAQSVTPTKRRLSVWASAAVGVSILGLFAYWVFTRPSVEPPNRAIAQVSVPRPLDVPDVPFDRGKSSPRESGGQSAPEVVLIDPAPTVESNSSTAHADEASKKAAQRTITTRHPQP